MKRTGKSRDTEARYIELDIRKEYMLAGEQNAGQEWVIPPRRISMERLVAHAGGVRQIAEARVKTDKEDVKRLIRLLIANIVP